VALLQQVSIVVVPEMPGWGGIPEIPAIRDTMRRRFESAWKGDFFPVYRLSLSSSSNISRTPRL